MDVYGVVRAASDERTGPFFTIGHSNHSNHSLENFAYRPVGQGHVWHSDLSSANIRIRERPHLGQVT